MGLLQKKRPGMKMSNPWYTSSSKYQDLAETIQKIDNIRDIGAICCYLPMLYRVIIYFVDEKWGG